MSQKIENLLEDLLLQLKKLKLRKFTTKNLGVKRPGYGKSLLKFFHILGKYSKKIIKKMI